MKFLPWEIENSISRGASLIALTRHGDYANFE